MAWFSCHQSKIYIKNLKALTIGDHLTDDLQKRVRIDMHLQSQSYDYQRELQVDCLLCTDCLPQNHSPFTDVCYRRWFPSNTPARIRYYFQYRPLPGHKRGMTLNTPIPLSQQSLSHWFTILISKTRSSDSNNISKARNRDYETTRRTQSSSSCYSRSWSLSKRSWNKITNLRRQCHSFAGRSTDDGKTYHWSHQTKQEYGQERQGWLKKRNPKLHRKGKEGEAKKTK